jgi:peptidoglycan hydrolase CwlO-like protein
MSPAVKEFLVLTALLLAASFTIGWLGARAAVDRFAVEHNKTHEGVEAELDQIQGDVDDLQRRIDAMDVRLTRIEALIEARFDELDEEGPV